MYLRINHIKFTSKIDADGMKALAKYEMIDNLKGIISIEVVSITEVEAIAILKFQNKEDEENSRSVYIDHFKKQSNIKVESFTGIRDFIVEK